MLAKISSVSFCQQLKSLVHRRLYFGKKNDVVRQQFPYAIAVNGLRVFSYAYADK